MQMVKVRIYHGYIRRWKARHLPKEIGGWFGGHVVMQIDEKVFGFIYSDKSNIHIFSRKKNKNGVFHEYTLEAWESIVADKKETIVEIPVSENEKTFLIDYYTINQSNPSVDYSFFGERCASSCYHLLKKIGKMQGGHYLFNAFYPGQFTRHLVKTAARKGYKVYEKEGPGDRIWH
jgi:hypothetical protein